MFENLLASIGINSMKIETLVKNKSIHSNDTLEGIVKIESGISAQTINKISLTLVERYENPDKNSQFSVLENELQTFILHTNVELEEHHTITEKFKFNIYEYEFKSEPKHLILKTHAYIGHSVDAYDEDQINFKQ
ncbi:sporulation protein [Staphylococcus caledonicus]|uniref:sporulation protein n=1 Tax=Staphylococcus sp. acrmy TaxID=2929076 RepID=UPI001F575AEF|nr:sporulation protein [Staphylococcus sp. acrmy]MCI2948381.1 sporulation protein [Staphylococcus sp. acrmy]